MTSRIALLVLAATATAEAIEANSTNATEISLDTGLSVELLPPIKFNTRGIPYPDFRFTPWGELDVMVKADAKIAGCKSLCCRISAVKTFGSKPFFVLNPQTPQTLGIYQVQRRLRCIPMNQSSLTL